MSLTNPEPPRRKLKGGGRATKILVEVNTPYSPATTSQTYAPAVDTAVKSAKQKNDTFIPSLEYFNYN